MRKLRVGRGQLAAGTGSAAGTDPVAGAGPVAGTGHPTGPGNRPGGAAKPARAAHASHTSARSVTLARRPRTGYHDHLHRYWASGYPKALIMSAVPSVVTDRNSRAPARDG